MTGAEYSEHLAQLATFAREVADFAGLSLRTVRRWCADQAPAYALRLADAAAGVIRGGVFDGWRAQGDTLSGPTGERYTLADIRAAHWQRQLAQALEHENRHLREQIAALTAERDALQARPTGAKPCAPRHWRPATGARPQYDQTQGRGRSDAAGKSSK